MTEHDIHVMKYCVKAYLSYIRTTDDAVREMEMRMREVRSKLELMGVSFDGASVASTGGDRIGEGLAVLDELADEYGRRIAEYYRMYNDARDLCTPHHVGRWAVWMHEVERRTWAYVGRVIGYSERQTKTIADGGYAEIYGLMPEEFRRYAIPNAQPRDGKDLGHE